MRPLILTSLVFVVSCSRPEEPLDNTRVRGTVRIDAVHIDESAQAELENRNWDGGSVLETINFVPNIIDGTLEGFDVTAEGEPGPSADHDWWLFNSPFYMAEAYADGNPRPDPTEPAVFTITLDDATAVARVEIANTDELEGAQNRPTVVMAADITGSGEMTFDVQANVNYGIHIAGLEGPGDVGYSIAMPSQHPDEANILVGAYETDDVFARGNPVAGTNAGPFEEVSPGTWEASYEMLLVRGVETTIENEGELNQKNTTKVNEKIKEAWIYAGNFPNLGPNLSAGTWYSGTAVHVDIAGAKPEQLGKDEEPEPGAEIGPVATVDEVAVIDSVAPLVIGQEFDEVEPNNVGMTGYGLDLSTIDQATDAGTLSGPGFVDVFRGTNDITSSDSAWTHDMDTWSFMVPEPSWLYFKLDWDDDAADIDAPVFDSTGAWVDGPASGAKPDVDGGYWLFEPGEVYYLTVLGYVGTEGSAPAYELFVEQTAAR